MADKDPKTSKDPTKDSSKDYSLPDIGTNIFEGESRGALTQDPVEHPNTNVQNYLDYTGNDINLLTDDADKIRARNQSVWSQLGGFVNQAVVGEIVGGSIEGLGYLLDVKGMVDIASGQENEWGNWLSDIGKGMRKWTEKTTPIYAENPGSFDPTDIGWWLKNGVSVASTLSLMIPSGLGLKALEYAGEGLAGLAEASRGIRAIDKGMEIAQKAGEALPFTDDAVRGITQAFMSRHAENMMEASGVYQEKYQNLINRGLTEEQARKRASEGAAETYKIDSAMLLQDIGQYTLLHKLIGAPASGAEEAIKGAEKGLKLGHYGEIAADFASEAGEEAFQYVAQEEGKYQADINAGLRDPSKFSDRLKAYSSDGEMLTSAFFGGFGSFAMQTLGPSIMRKLGQKVGGFNNNPVDNVKNYMSQMAQSNRAIKAARQNGMHDQADYLEDRTVVGMTISNLDRGSEGGHAAVLHEMANMTPEQAQKWADKVNKESDYKIDPQSVIKKAGRHSELASKTIEVYNKLKNKYGKDIAGPATMNMMENIMAKNKVDKKNQQLSDLQANIPQYSDLSGYGQSKFDLDVQKKGLQRAQKATKLILDNVEEDPELSDNYQQALENLQAREKAVDKKISELDGSERSDEETQQDSEILDNLNSHVEEGAKLVSEREVANQVANINANSYDSKIQLAKDKAAKEARQKKARNREDFDQNTVPVNIPVHQMKKGDPVKVNGMPGEYVGSYKKNGEVIHKVKDLSDNKGSNWEIPESEFNDKVDTFKYRQDVADDNERRQSEKQSRKEQENVRKSKKRNYPGLTKEAEELINKVEHGAPTTVTNNMKRVAQENGIEIDSSDSPQDVINKLKNKAENQGTMDNPISPTVEQQAPEAMDGRPTPPTDQGPQNAGPREGGPRENQGPPEQQGPPEDADLPVIPSREQLEKQQEATSTEEPVEDLGGAEDINVPPNNDNGKGKDPHLPSSKNRLSHTVEGLGLTISSTSNPGSYINQDVRDGKMTENSPIYQDRKALSDFLENGGSIAENGTYLYYVKTSIDMSYLEQKHPDIYEKVQRGERLETPELDKLPITTTFYNISDDSVVERKGREVYSYLHTPGYLERNMNANEDAVQQHVQDLRDVREKAYAAHLDGTHLESHIIDKLSGHFLRDENVDLGDFGSYNYVHEVFGEKPQNITLGILDSGGMYTDSNGQQLNELSLIENAPERAGAVYAATLDANGRQKPMRLFVDTFTDEEAGLLYDLYDAIAGNATPNQVISDDIKRQITESGDKRTREIEKALDKPLNDTSYLDLINFLVYEGDKTKGKGLSTLHLDLAGKDTKLVYGTEGEITRADFAKETKKDKFINWLQNNRRRQITRRLINSPNYNNYLMENGIVKTTATRADNGALLIGPMPIAGEFSLPTKKGDIDHVEDANKAPWEEPEDTGDQTFGDIFQKKEISNAESLPESMSERGMKRMMDRLKERFNVNYQFINDSKVDWAGKFENGTVFINTAHATMDTPFHEFAHPLLHVIKKSNVRLYMGLIDEMRNSPQGRRIMDRVRNAYPEHTTEQMMDEALVQSLGELAANNIRTDESNFRRALRNLWISLKRLMRRIFNVDTKVDPTKLDPNTSLEELSSMLSDDLTDIDLSGQLVTAEQRPERMSPQQYHDWVDSMTYVMLNSNTSKDISDFEDISMTSIRNTIYNTLQTMDESDPLYEEYQYVLDEITQEGSNELDPQSKLLMAVQRKLRGYGITPDQEVQPEERDSRLNIRASYEFSNKDKASVNVKLMIAMIPKLNSAEPVINKFSKDENDKKPDYKISPHTGLPQFHNFGDTWNVLQRTLSNVVAQPNEDLYKKFIKKLQEASTLRPEMQFLINHLENSPEYKRTEFTQVLSLAPQNFSSTFFRKSGSKGFKFNIGSADTQSVEDQVTDEWASNYRNNLASFARTQEGKQVMTIDEQKARELIARYDDLTHNITRVAKNINPDVEPLKRELQDLLSDTGIEISLRGIEKLMQETGKKTAIDAFNTIVRGTHGSSVRFVYKQGKFSLENLAGNPYIFSEDNVRMSITEEAFVRKMASAESYFRNDLADSTIIGPGNKPFWMYSSYNSMHLKIASWRENSAELDKILSVPYNRHSVWGEWLQESQENRDNFKLLNFMNFRQEFSSDPGSKNTELGITDLLSDKINRTLKGIFSLPSRADNTTEYQIQGPSAKKSFRKTENSVELTDSAVNTLRGYILDEVARIKHAEKQIEALPEKDWIKDYHYKLDENGNKDTSLGNAFKIHLMPSLNPLTSEQQQALDEGTLDRVDNSHILFDSRGRAKVITEDIVNQLEAPIRQAFERQFRNDLQKMIQHRVITKTSNQLKNNSIDLEKMDYYNKETGSEHFGVQAAVMDYTFNGIIANQEWHKLFGGDIASYASREDFQKRATAPGSTGLIYRIMDDMKPTYNSAVVSDIIVPSDLVSNDSIKAIAEYTGKTQKEIRSILDDYNNVDRADAQAWITPEQYRDRMRGYGKWTTGTPNSHEAAYQRLMNGEQLPEDLKMFMQPLKTVHTEMKIENGNNIFHYNKQSEAVLHPDIANALNLGNLLDAMRSQDVDHVIVESGKKVGARGITTIADEQGDILDADNIELNPVALDKRYTFLQQELPTKGMKPAKEGSQVRKNILEGIIDEESYTLPDGTEMNGTDFRQEMHNVLGNLSDKGLDEIKNYIEWNENTGEFNKTKLYNYLLESFTKREVNDNLVKALRANIPFDAIPQMRVAIENQLAAMVNKKAVDLRHDTGGSFIQMSDVGYTTRLPAGMQEMVMYIKDDAKDGLKPPRIDPETGEFKPGQILIPHKIMKQIKGLNESQLKEVMKDIATGISYRIPNQSMSSNDVVEIAGVLPEEMGDTVVAYKEVTTKYGSDFDIDKLQIMLPNYYVRDGKVQVAKFENIDTSDTGQLRELYRDQYQSKKNFFNYLQDLLTQKQLNLASSSDNMIDYFETHEDQDIMIDAERNLTLRDYNRIQSEVVLMPTEDEFVEKYKGASVYEVNSKEAVQNRKLELYRAMLSNKNTVLEMMKPLESDWLKNAIRENSPAKSYDGDFEAFSPTTQAEIRKTFVDTKAAVGQIANHTTDHAFSQSADLYIKQEDETGAMTPHYIGIGNSIETADGKASYLSGIYDESGNERIMDTLSAFMTANVDAAKDPYITDGNFNLFTNPVALLLTRAGVPRQFVVDFMDQDIVRDYSDVTSEYEGRTSQRYRVQDKGEVTPIEWITWKYSKGMTDEEGKSLQTTELGNVTDVDSIDPRKLMKNLRDNPSKQDKLNALALFNRWKGISSSLGESIQASKADVNGMGASIISGGVVENLRNKVEEDDVIGNFQNKFNNTFLQHFYNNSVRAGQQLFKSSFLHRSQAVKDLIDSVTSKLGMHPLTSNDIAFRLNAEAYAYLMSGSEFGVDQKKLKSMYIGSDTMAKKLMKLKGAKNSPVRENPMIQYLGYKTGNEEGDLDFIYGQGSKQLSVEAQNELTEAWNDLWLHDNKFVRNFAKDLAIYAYYGSGFTRNLTSFFELIPVSLNESLGINDYIEGLQSDLETDANPLVAATDQIIKNLSDDGRIVPNLSLNSPSLRKLEDLHKSDAFGIVPGDNENMVIGHDESGRPVMKPFIKMDGKLFEYRGLGSRAEETEDSVAPLEMGIYTPTNDYGIKQGRFRVKEYYMNLSDMSSVFDQNNVEIDPKVSDVMNQLGVEMNYPSKQASSTEKMVETNIEDELRKIEGITDEQVEQFKKDYEKNKDKFNNSVEEYVSNLEDYLNCT